MIQYENSNKTNEDDVYVAHIQRMVKLTVIAFKNRFTSGYADCCNVGRMQRNHYDKKDWYCAFKSKIAFRQDACGKATFSKSIRKLYKYTVV